jgi:hypothetical protein
VWEQRIERVVAWLKNHDPNGEGAGIQVVMEALGIQNREREQFGEQTEKTGKFDFIPVKVPAGGRGGGRLKDVPGIRLKGDYQRDLFKEERNGQ